MRSRTENADTSVFIVKSTKTISYLLINGEFPNNTVFLGLFFTLQSYSKSSNS